jgi:hypothetical protein
MPSSEFKEVMHMAVSVRDKKPKSSAVAVRTLPPSTDIERTTDFYRADSFDCVEVDGIAVYQVHRGDKVVASYPASMVVGIRMSPRPFRTDKVTFVRRIERTS